MRAFLRASPFAFAFALLGAIEGEARAGDARVDTTYGRLDGDVGVVLGAGATFGPRAPRASLDARLRYMDSAGLFGTYEDAIVATASDPSRVVSAGFELRPLFLARWLKGQELGLPRLDLFLDSFGLELGAFWAQPSGGSFAATPGLQASLGLEVPLFASANGVWLAFHGGGRWSDAALEGGPIAGPHDRALFVSVTIAYHATFAAHVVDAGDAALR